MGLAKLDDAEYARRARERNNRVNAAHRQRLLDAGKAQTNVWLSAELRARLEREAGAGNISLSAATEALLLDGLAYRRGLANPATPLPPVNTLPPFDAPPSPVEDAPAPVDRDKDAKLFRVLNPAPVEDAPAPADRDSRILELHRQGLSNYAIAAQVGCSEATARRVVNRAKQEATPDRKTAQE